MNTDFPRILSLLRKERGLTQKQVAADLDIAQALLSHYEKGKRECGLEFLVKAADYYNVSTDYLLGRSPVSNGGIITESDIPDGGNASDSKSGDIMLALNKKLITNSIEVIFSLLQKINDNAGIQDCLHKEFNRSSRASSNVMVSGTLPNRVSTVSTRS